MSEQGVKKVKIFNLAKELNLSSETIIEFLKKKGFEVKSHMSTVTDDMMPVIMGHFKKDKEVADRHQRKLQEFRSTRKKETVEKTEKVGKASPVKEEAVHQKSKQARKLAKSLGCKGVKKFLFLRLKSNKRNEEAKFPRLNRKQGKMFLRAVRHRQLRMEGYYFRKSQLRIG